jgi:diguanylate cyclase (GGDEF)-like protein
VAGLGLVLLGITSGAGEADRFVLLYLPVFVFLALSQRRTLTLGLVPVAAVTFVVGFGAAGLLTAADTARFAVVLGIGASVAVARSAPAVLVTGAPSVSLGLAHLVDGTRALEQATRADEVVALFEKAMIDLVGATDIVTFVRASAPDDRMVRVVGGGTSGNLPKTTAPLPTANGAGLTVAPSDLVALAAAGRRRFVPAIADWKVDGAVPLLPGDRAALFVPLMGMTGPLGFTIVGWQGDVAPLDDVADDAVELLAMDAAEALDRCRLRQALADAPPTDPLTGLLSRRVVESRLDGLESGDVVMVIDLDDFRDYNARRGISAGDRTVRTLAACLVDSCRRADWCGRLSHEEFIVVFRGAGDSSMVAVSRLRDRWSRLESDAKFSAGVAVHEPGWRPADTLAHAEGALDLAKDRGRNRVEFFPG